MNNLLKQPDNKKRISLAKILWTFRERVKEERKKGNITQSQLAESADVSLDIIKRLETGKSVKVEVAYKIAEALRVPFESLFPQQDLLSDEELIERIRAAQNTLQLLIEKLQKK